MKSHESFEKRCRRPAERVRRRGVVRGEQPRRVQPLVRREEGGAGEAGADAVPDGGNPLGCVTQPPRPGMAIQ